MKNKDKKKKKSYLFIYFDSPRILKTQITRNWVFSLNFTNLKEIEAHAYC